MEMNKYSPVFIVGSERSGTNLIRKRITEIQDIYFGPSPAHFLKHLYYRQPLYGTLSEDDHFLDLISDALDLCYIHFSPWEIELDKNEVLNEYSTLFEERNVILLTHYLMMKYSYFKGYECYICKDNFLYEFAYQIMLHLPNAKFIYLHRDPRDYALSQLKRSRMTNSLYKISKLWQYEQIKSLALYNECKFKNIIKVSYENFITNELGELNNICNFLEVPMNNKRKDIPCLNTGSTEEWVNLNNETMTTNYNKYKKELNQKQIRIIESICWDELKLLGYTPENRVKPKINKFVKYLDIILGLAKSGFTKFKAPESQSEIYKKRSSFINKLSVNYRKPD